MKFYVTGQNSAHQTVKKKFESLLKEMEIAYPSFVLHRDYFDDYNFKTSFVLYYVTSKTSSKRIGILRILDLENQITLVRNSFTQLSKTRYCSLGESIEFYENLSSLGEETFNSTLIALNDAFFDVNVYQKFANEPGFETSLLRYSISKLLFTAPREELMKKISSSNFILTSDSPSPKFKFSTKLEYALSEHIATFDFSGNSSKYNRIRILIGKNGSGKTSYLRNLALAISGEQKNIGRFSPRKPDSVSSTIMISYSAFDSFQMPKQNNGAYVFCGIPRVGKISHEQIIKDIDENLLTLKSSKKREVFFEILRKSELYFEDQFLLNDDTKLIKNLSSGQAILIKYVTDIIKNVQENSFILIDEIETHLHPNFLIGLLKFLTEILHSFNSYCILSTHSPLVVQELDIDRALIFLRDGNEPTILQRKTNYIAESLSDIVDDIFELSPRDHLYTDILKNYQNLQLQDEIFNSSALAILRSGLKAR